MKVDAVAANFYFDNGGMDQDADLYLLTPCIGRHRIALERRIRLTQVGVLVPEEGPFGSDDSVYLADGLARSGLYRGP